MARSYSFSDLITYSGLTRNQAKHLVQSKVIRADLKRARGPGAYAVYGFLDVFDASIAGRLYALPGGWPMHAVANALIGLELLTEIEDLALGTNSWAKFLDPQTRRPTATGFYYCLSPGGKVRLLEGEALPGWMATNAVVVTIRLDTLLLELEAKTHDHTTTEERLRAWKRERGKRRGAALDIKSPPAESAPPEVADSPPSLVAKAREER
jgi:hypothetical protein